jgi:hypothetical protein
MIPNRGEAKRSESSLQAVFELISEDKLKLELQTLRRRVFVVFQRNVRRIVSPWLRQDIESFKWYMDEKVFKIIKLLRSGMAIEIRRSDSTIQQYSFGSECRSGILPLKSNLAVPLKQ